LDIDQSDKQGKKGQSIEDGPGNRSSNSNGFTIDRSKVDLRVFLVPQGVSTLGHWLAMYDDLYCHNVYNFFNSNTLLGMCVAKDTKKEKDFSGHVNAFLNKDT